MTAVSFSTIAQPNPGSVLFVEIPESVVKKLGAGKRKAPRTVEVPADVARALSTGKLRPTFDGFSFSGRREFAESITSAKRAETRAARLGKVLAEVRAKARAVSTK